MEEVGFSNNGRLKSTLLYSNYNMSLSEIRTVIQKLEEEVEES